MKQLRGFYPVPYSSAFPSNPPGLLPQSLFRPPWKGMGHRHNSSDQWVWEGKRVWVAQCLWTCPLPPWHQKQRSSPQRSTGWSYSTYSQIILPNPVMEVLESLSVSAAESHILRTASSRGKASCWSSFTWFLCFFQRSRPQACSEVEKKYDEPSQAPTTNPSPNLPNLRSWNPSIYLLESFPKCFWYTTLAKNPDISTRQP